MSYDLVRNLAQIRENIRTAALKSGRLPTEIQLLAVTKRSDLDQIKALYQLGIRAMGENRVQDLLAKQKLLPSDINWHLIGSLQTNKVKAVVGQTTLIHSLDRWNLAEELQKRAAEAQKTAEVLVEVNISGEASKAGFSPAEVKDFLKQAGSWPNLEIKGLMTMAPKAANPEEVRYVFREARLLAADLRLVIPDFNCLSMGMSHDYQVAIEEGATLVRLGTALFS